MILKIRRNYGKEWTEVPEVTVECDRFDRRAFVPDDNKIGVAQSMFCDDDGEVNPLYTIRTYINRKFSELFLLGHATVFVMIIDGKTIATIYT